MKMPEKSPDLWAAVITWLSDHEYQLYAAAMGGFGACWVGFIGVEQIRAWAIRLGERRIDK